MKPRAQAGDLIAVQGIGGLGHMAAQYARKMGFKVVAIGRGSSIAEASLALGAHIYIDTEKEDAAARLQQLGGAQAIRPRSRTPTGPARAIRPRRSGARR